MSKRFATFRRLRCSLQNNHDYRLGATGPLTAAPLQGLYTTALTRDEGSWSWSSAVMSVVGAFALRPWTYVSTAMTDSGRNGEGTRRLLARVCLYCLYHGL